LSIFLFWLGFEMWFSCVGRVNGKAVDCFYETSEHGSNSSKTVAIKPFPQARLVTVM